MPWALNTKLPAEENKSGLSLILGLGRVRGIHLTWPVSNAGCNQEMPINRGIHAFDGGGGVDFSDKTNKLKIALKCRKCRGKKGCLLPADFEGEVGLSWAFFTRFQAGQGSWHSCALSTWNRTFSYALQSRVAMPIEELEFRVYELDLELELGLGLESELELPDRRTGQNVLKYAQTAKQPNSHSHGFSSGLLVWF